MTQIASKRTRAAGIDTHFLAAGSSGPPIVAVHGGGAGADARGNWTSVIPRLASDHRVFAVDMVGFGGTEKPCNPEYAYSQAERDEHLVAFVSALGVGPVILVGNSMGGLTSLGVARMRPELVRGLVLMGSAGIHVEPSDALRTIIEYDYTIDGMRRIVTALTAPGFAVSDDIVRYRHGLSVEKDARYAYQRITGWMKQNGGLAVATERIRSVKAKTLVVAGKEDRVVPVACAYRFLELLDNSWGYIVPHCGHWPMIEQPDAFAAVVTHFTHLL